MGLSAAEPMGEELHISSSFLARSHLKGVASRLLGNQYHEKYWPRSVKHPDHLYHFGALRRAVGKTLFGAVSKRQEGGSF